MQLLLTPEAERLIAARIAAGQYESPEAVVNAALFALQELEQFGAFAPGEIDALVAEADASGPPIDGETFFAEWRALRKAPRAGGSS